MPLSFDFQGGPGRLVWLVACLDPGLVAFNYLSIKAAKSIVSGWPITRICLRLPNIFWGPLMPLSFDFQGGPGRLVRLVACLDPGPPRQGSELRLARRLLGGPVEVGLDGGQ